MRKEYTPMFEEENYENILDRSLERITDEVDKREGAIVFDALAPASLEIALMYGYLDFLFKNAFAHTANRYWLIERAKERGVIPHEASKSIVVGVFDREIQLGYRFSIDELYFVVTEFVEMKNNLFYYNLTCETPGTIGNIESGKLIPAQSINGLNVSEIYKLIILGEDEEATEDFRDRYFATIDSKAYGGNIADYKLKTKAIEGVGAVRVIPVWNGGGTVKVIITDSEYGEPTTELVTKIQEILDPVPFHQKGVGVAPIGHYVTVVGAKKRLINVECSINTDIALNEIRESVDKEVEEYLLSLRKAWEKLSLLELEGTETITVRLNRILSIILNAKGIIDFVDIKFTDSDSQIIELAEDELPFLGEISLKVV